MKTKFIGFLILCVLLQILSGCLEANLPDMEESAENTMTAFNFEYRWTSYTLIYDKTTNIVVDSIEYVNVKTINTLNEFVLNSDGSYTVNCTLSLPSGIPAAETVSLTKLWGYASVPDAATVTPIGNAPELGTPGDYSSTVSYLVTAANGNTKEFIIVASGL